MQSTSKMTKAFKDEVDKINSVHIKNELLQNYFNDVASARAAVLVDKAMDEAIRELKQHITNETQKIGNELNRLNHNLVVKFDSIESRFDRMERRMDRRFTALGASSDKRFTRMPKD